MTVANKAGLLEQIESLPPLPAIVRRVLEVTKGSDSSADDVARVLSEDQAIAAKILRVANSSFYGTERQVTQISRAVVMLGSVGVRNLVLGVAARDAFKSGTVQTPEHTTLWRHSIATASAAELIARQVRYKPPEEAFVAGLLHDIGQLAMVTFEPESFRAIFREQGHGVRFLTLERSHFNLDHTEAGFQILTRWRLPEAICQVALHHHEREIGDNEPLAQLLAVVMLADTIAHLMGFGVDMPVGRLKRAETSARLLALDDSEQMRIISGLSHRIEQANEMFASVDTARHHREPTVAKRAVWVSPESTDHRSISQLLLEHHGYEVLRVSPGDLYSGLSPDDLAIFSLSEENAAVRLASDLTRRGHHRIVLLSDPADGATLRRRDVETGVCFIPRLFTAFDIHWIEEQLGL